MSQEIHAERCRVAGAGRKVIVTPTAGRQAFELEMRIGGKALRALLVDMSAIVEDAEIGELLKQRLARFAAELFVDGLVVLQPVRRIFRIETLALHALDASRADTIRREDDIEEQTLRGVALRDFARLVENVFPIGRHG